MKRIMLVIALVLVMALVAQPAMVAATECTCGGVDKVEFTPYYVEVWMSFSMCMQMGAGLSIASTIAFISALGGGPASVVIGGALFAMGTAFFIAASQNPDGIIIYFLYVPLIPVYVDSQPECAASHGSVGGGPPGVLPTGVEYDL